MPAECVPSVSTIPGLMALTRIWRGPSSLASDFGIVSTAAFVALYTDALGGARLAATELMLMILPPAGSIMLDGLLRHQKQAQYIEVEQREKVLHRDLFQRQVLVEARVVDEDVELAERFLRFGKQMLNILGLGDIGLESDRLPLLVPNALDDGIRAGPVAWEKFLERDPPEHDAWYGYAQLCLFLGQEAAYRRDRKALLERFGDRADDWILTERTSLACLLLPASGDELRGAVVLADRAVAIGPKAPDPDHAYVQFVKGLAEYRQGRPAQAVP